MSTVVTIEGKMRRSLVPHATYVRRIVFFLLVSLLLALAYLKLKNEQMKLGYRISQNKELQRKLERDNAALSARYVELSSPLRLGRLGRQMGFRYPTQEDVIYIEQTTVVGERDGK